MLKTGESRVFWEGDPWRWVLLFWAACRAYALSSKVRHKAPFSRDVSFWGTQALWKCLLSFWCLPIWMLARHSPRAKTPDFGSTFQWPIWHWVVGENARFSPSAGLPELGEQQWCGTWGIILAGVLFWVYAIGPEATCGQGCLFGTHLIWSLSWSFPLVFHALMSKK